MRSEMDLSRTVIEAALGMRPAHLSYPYGDPGSAGPREFAIAAELVRAHGGEIRLVEGTIGATLRLTIPDRAVELSTHRGARAQG